MKQRSGRQPFMRLSVDGSLDIAPSAISTGRLPPTETVRAIVREAYDEARLNADGTVADYIPALGRADPSLFGVCVIGVNGNVHEFGDVTHAFSIQSVSKPLVFALVCQTIGAQAAMEKLGVNATGLPFNSVMAVELNPNRTMNAMVNAGAIAATSLVPGDTAAAKFEFILDGISRFAGRRLEVDEEVYRSEADTNQRNRGIAKLLEGYGRVYFDSLEATDVYTRQCAINVTAHDLAVIAATLADGGVNPMTKKRVVDASVCAHTLAVVATSGLYELSGEWLYDIGLPGKSGVSGGIFAVAPGKGGVGTFAPLVDKAGNSIKGQLISKRLSQRLGLNLFASANPG